jgi:hypothetical protein
MPGAALFIPAAPPETSPRRAAPVKAHRPRFPMETAEPGCFIEASGDRRRDGRVYGGQHQSGRRDHGGRDCEGSGGGEGAIPAPGCFNGSGIVP